MSRWLTSLRQTTELSLLAVRSERQKYLFELEESADAFSSGVFKPPPCRRIIPEHSMILFMNHSPKKVFISYVKEDSAHVDELCKVLKVAGVPYWRDREALAPGDAWRDKIREAIRQESMVFLACFSDNSNAKLKSYMNEELTLAVEEYRQIAPDQTWIIPIRFDDVQLPKWELSTGRTLSDINYVNFFGDSKLTAASELTQKLGKLMGINPPDPRQIQATIENENAEERAIHLKRLTKNMLLDPQKQIELDDLVSNEIKRLLDILNETEPDEQYNQLRKSSERVIFTAERAEYLAQISAPFCETLQVATQWGNPEQITPWSEGILTLVRAANEKKSRHEPLNHLRHIPSVVAILTSAITATYKSKWTNLKKLVCQSDSNETQEQKFPTPIPILNLTNPQVIMDRKVANTILLAEMKKITLQEAANRETPNFDAPEANWVYHTLRPWFNDLIPSQKDYDYTFDQAEVMIGTLSLLRFTQRGKDIFQIIQTEEEQEESFYSIPRTHWIGRAQRWAEYDNNTLTPIEIFTRNGLMGQKKQWPPLKDGLFMGPGVAEVAFSNYEKHFKKRIQ